MNNKTSDSFDLGIIPRLILFVILPNAVVTPLRIFVEAVIEGKESAPEFITVGFLIYGICAKLVFGFGYVLFGYRLPVKNTVLRGFAYIMLILCSSYLPNILAMAGGDGEIIAESLTAGIVAVDVISYLLEGLVLGLLMKKYDVKAPGAEHRKGANHKLICLVNGVLFAALNVLADLVIGAANSSWRFCAILKVTPQRETVFYLVFTAFMFIAGALLPIWYRYCLPAEASYRKTVLFGIKLAAVIWLPNVLIMAFFGTPALLTAAYGGAYILMFAASILVYQKLDTSKNADCLSEEHPV